MLILVFAFVFAFAYRARVLLVAAQRREMELAIQTKELGSWNRIKELGFDDVLEWEAAFLRVTGELPEGSRTKELESQRALMQQPWENTFEHEARVGAEVRYGQASSRMMATARILTPFEMQMEQARQGAPIRIDNAQFQNLTVDNFPYGSYI